MMIESANKFLQDPRRQLKMYLDNKIKQEDPCIKM